MEVDGVSLRGAKFHRWTVLRESNQKYKLLCTCECGTVKDVWKSHLKSGKSKSCGCLRRDSGRITIKQNANTHKKDFPAIKKRMEKTYIDRYVKEGTNIKNLDMNIRHDNKSGVKGVSWNKKRNSWHAYISFKGKRIHLGWFREKRDAVEVRKEAERIYFEPIIEKYKQEENINDK